MNGQQAKRMKEEIRQVMRLTRPPRLEGKVKEAMMQPAPKAKHGRIKPQRPHKMQGITMQQRKDYQLRSKQ